MCSATFESVVCSSVESSASLEARRVPLATLRRIAEIEHLVDGFVASWHSSDASLQSRHWHRLRFEKPLLITPLDESRDIPSGAPFIVSGRDISLTGISFTHDRPLPARKVAVSFCNEGGVASSIVTLLRWCRFRRDGIYQSGGQFLREIEMAEHGESAALTGFPRSF